MVATSVQPTPDTTQSVDGSIPVDMIVSLESVFDQLEKEANSILGELQTSLSHDCARISQVFSYGMEDVSKNSAKIWDNSMGKLEKLQVSMLEYARAIGIGGVNLNDRVEALMQKAVRIKNEPYRKQITIKAAKKYNLNGKYEPRLVEPVLFMAMDAFKFYDQYFLKYLDSIILVLSKLTFDHDFAENGPEIDFTQFNPTKWMTRPIPVEQDPRIRTQAPIFRSGAVQGNRALYASGVIDRDKEHGKDWSYVVNTVRDFSFRFYTVPGLKDPTGDALVLDVDRTSELRSRLSKIHQVTTRMKARKGYEAKLTAGLRKLQTTAERIRGKAGSFKDEIDETDKQLNKEDSVKGRPAISDILQSVTLMINNYARMVTDYNNCMAGIVRLIGALVYVTEQELRAYDEPLRQTNSDPSLKGITP